MKTSANSKVISIICFSVSLILFYTLNVHAYIDPSVMTYAIQAIAGIGISIGMFAGIYWRRLKKKLGLRSYRASTSILDDQLVYNDPRTGNRIEALGFIAPEVRSAMLEEARKEAVHEERSGEIQTAVLLAVTISYLWMVYAQLQLQFLNMLEFKYDIYAVIPTLLLMFAVGVITALLVYCFLHKCSVHLFTVGIVFSLVVLIGTYVQGNFLVKNLQALDGSEIIWTGHVEDHLSSLVLWVALFIIAGLLIKRLGRLAFFYITRMICIVLLVALIVTNVSTGILNNGFQRKRSAAVTTLYEYTMSEDKNFVIIIIDAANGETLRNLLETDNPEYYEVLKDFTFFPNTVGAYTYTRQAIPQILTGRWYEYQTGFSEFVTEGMEKSPLLEELHKRNYRIGIYDEELVFDSEKIYELENVIFSRYHLASFAEYARSSFCLMWYMYAPFAMKKIFANPNLYITLRWLAQAEEETYNGDNGTFFERQNDADLEIVQRPCFRFIHIDGAHVPFHWDKDVNRISDEEGSYEQNYQSSITIVSSYLEKMKNANVYDNTAIIVMADHGYDLEDKGDIARENPLLLIKGRNENHDFQISEQPVSYMDLMGMYKDLLDGKQSTALLPYEEYEQRNRRIIVYNFGNDANFYEYYQTGYASDESTMIPTGEVYNTDHPGKSGD